MHIRNKVHIIVATLDKLICCRVLSFKELLAVRIRLCRMPATSETNWTPASSSDQSRTSSTDKVSSVIKRERGNRATKSMHDAATGEVLETPRLVTHGDS